MRGGRGDDRLRRRAAESEFSGGAIDAAGAGTESAPAEVHGAMVAVAATRGSFEFARAGATGPRSGLLALAATELERGAIVTE